MEAATQPARVTHPVPVLVGQSPCIEELRAEIDAAARSDAKVLITGETGVGKEVVARLIHSKSTRRDGPFVTINCAGVPDSLLESEFFGHARGSFTGAYRDNPGLLRQAHRGTVFLDEVGEMSLRMQALLLRFLETGEIQTVGGGIDRRPVSVRVITATNRELQEAVAAHEFREDLYYRLNVVRLSIPAVRERHGDVDLLMNYYFERYAQDHRVDPPVLSPQAREVLGTYAWPGNVRELKNTVERLVLRCAGRVVQATELPAEITSVVSAKRTPHDDGALISHRHRVESIVERILERRESFWTSAYPAFMSRDLTRDDLRYIVRLGLEQTRGSYRMVLALFNMPPEDYKRFLAFLRQHDCHLPFQRFRMLHVDRLAADNRDRSSVAK